MAAVIPFVLLLVGLGLVTGGGSHSHGVIGAGLRIGLIVFRVVGRGVAAIVRLAYEVVNLRSTVVRCAACGRESPAVGTCRCSGPCGGYVSYRHVWSRCPAPECDHAIKWVLCPCGYSIPRPGAIWDEVGKARPQRDHGHRSIA